MAKKDVEFRVGVIILIGIILLGSSLYWLQGYKLERNAQVIRVLFADVGTLSEGDRVTVSGVHKGKVNGLSLTDRGVLVELLLYKDVVLKRDARITIKNFGLMGERFIAITPGVDSLPFDTGSAAQGYYDAGLPEVMGLMGDMIVELRNIVRSLKRTVASDSSLGKFNNTVSNLERVSSSLADYVARNDTKFDKTVDNFYKASGQLNRLLAENSDKVDSAAQRLYRVSDGLDKFVVRLDTLSLHLRDFAASMNDPEGTLQLLVSDRRLYDDLRRTADNIDDLINDIRENPRKYINLKVELF
ncbi:MAG: MlaD family protein [candidate division Zixibacteria bacterium]|nr:MlaD family protein [candidate division Zixibacteria bacterium]